MQDFTCSYIYTATLIEPLKIQNALMLSMLTLYFYAPIFDALRSIVRKYKQTRESITSINCLSQILRQYEEGV